MNEYAPCPHCGRADAEKLRFTWWGGVIGPKVLNHVKCRGCGKGYNGKSGKNNTTGIVIYSAVVGVIIFGMVLAMFVALGVLMYATQ